MMLMTTKEAGEFLGLSPTRVIQLIKPDKRARRTGSHGGTPLCMYKRETLDNYLEQKAEKEQRKIDKALALELEGVEKPSDIWLSLTEAWLFLGKKFNKNVIRYNAPHTPFKGRPFFRKPDLLAIPDDATYVPSKKRLYRVCEKCGMSFKGRGEICKVCRKGYDEDDPFGVMIKPKLQKYRKCPVCQKSGVLLEGEYVCRSCKNDGRAESVIDPEIAYGRVAL